MAQMGGHLITAGGKRARPAVRGGLGGRAGARRGGGRRRGHRRRDPRWRLGGARAGGLAVPRRRDRRGRDPAGRRQRQPRWGNLKAILAGDFLLAKASEIAAGLGTEVAGLLAATIGRLCEGEVQRAAPRLRPGPHDESYLTAIEGKTAALFATACRVGGIVGELPRDRHRPAHRASACATAWPSRSSTTCSTSSPPTSSSASPPATTSSRASTTCPCCTRSRSWAATSARCSAARSTAPTSTPPAAWCGTSGGVDRSIDLARALHRRRRRRRSRRSAARPSAVALAGAATHLLVGVEEARLAGVP